MPLSEHEQRMLEQIETALYAEDPKFASTVRPGRFAGTSRRRKQALVLFICGLGMLVAGLVVGALKIGNFPVVSLVGFLVMFGAGLLALLGSRRGSHSRVPSSAAGNVHSISEGRRGAKTGSFLSRMEARYQRRIDGDDFR